MEPERTVYKQTEGNHSKEKLMPCCKRMTLRGFMVRSSKGKKYEKFFSAETTLSIGCVKKGVDRFVCIFFGQKRHRLF